MKKKRKSSSLHRDVGSFVGAGIGLGVGTAVIAGTGHGAAVLPAFVTAGRMMPIVGTAMIGKHALKHTQKMMSKRKNKRRH